MMIEKIVLNYLNENLEEPAYMEEPETAPAQYVVVEKTGGQSDNHILSATIVIQSYAPSMEGAAELNEIVKEQMENIIELDDISRCRLNSDYNYTDRTKKKYRYQAVFDFVYYNNRR